MTEPAQLGALHGHRIVPVLVVDDPHRARDVAFALAAGGIRCAEVTLRTPAAQDAIAAIADVPGFVVGAGTVLTTDQLDAVTDAGARFVVSPGLDPALVDRARARGIGVLPGAATATEVQHAFRLGLEVVKFFPADRLGGLDTIRALAAPFPGMGFVPSGGVDAAAMPAYLAHPSVPAVSGSWMATRAMIAEGELAAIEQRSAEAVAAVPRAEETTAAGT